MSASVPGSPPGLVAVRELIGLALRRNPRRAHLLVSGVLGKHVPVDPRVVRAAGLTLGLAVRGRGGDARDVAASAAAAGELRSAVRGGGSAAAAQARDAAAALVGASSAGSDLTGAAWVLGFAETATGLGQAVAEALGAPAFSSTRRPAGSAVTVSFTEAHSHASQHAVTAPAGLLRRPGTGVLVDDELSTGATALAAVRALHELCPRPAYVLATLVDVATGADRDALVAAVARLGARLEIVSLARGVIELPLGLAARAAALVAAAAGADAAAAAAAAAAVELGPLQAPAAVHRLDCPWPADLPDGARTGLPASLLPEVAAAASRVAAAVRAELAAPVCRAPNGPAPNGPAPNGGAPAGGAPAGRGSAGVPAGRGSAGAPAGRGSAGAPAGSGPVLVLATEEHLDVPLRIAEALADARSAGTDPQVLFASTTRSPVAAVDDPGYAVRTTLGFPSHDLPADGLGPRYAHNIARPPGDGDRSARWGAVVVVVDRAADTAALSAPGGLLDALGPHTDRLLVVATGPPAVVVAPQDPLRGPAFGSYRPAEVGWLLTDLSTVRWEPVAADREELLQTGRAHYAESLPVEYEPTAAYRRLYDEALTAGARRTALAVGLLAGLLLDRDSPPVALLSLARAGTPVGVLLRRWFARTGLDVPHLSVSIVRGRGIDRTALEWVAARFDPRRCVFVDGWTGKGAIARELRGALAELAAAGGPVFDADLAVLADPGSVTPLHGTREDWLVPSSCLNSTVSGLVSRTVLNDRLVGPADHHGGVFYAGLAAADRSGDFLDAVSGCFDGVAGEVADRLPGLVAGDRSPTWAGWAAVAAVAERYGITDANLVKPGVGEATRVLLRRVPWQVLVRRLGDPDLAHLERLAAERGVPLVVEADLPYACIGLIRPAGRPATAASMAGTAAVDVDRSGTE